MRQRDNIWWLGLRRNEERYRLIKQRFDEKYKLTITMRNKKFRL